MSVVKEVINSVDPAETNQTQTKELLQLIYELSEEKSITFANEIDAALRTAGTAENMTIPVVSILADQKEIRAVSSNTPSGDITDSIKKSLSGFIKGTTDGVIDGLVTLIDEGLQVVLGSSAGEERKDVRYYVCTDGLSIVRLDVIHWCRNIASTGITDKVEKSVVSIAKKSSVDLEKIDFNAFLSVYNEQLQKSGMSQQELIDAIQYAKKVYNILVDKDPRINMYRGTKQATFIPTGTVLNTN